MTIDHTYQVPSVAVHTDIFERAVRSVARVNGMPRMRYAFVPQPVMGKSAEELRAYIDGIDPVSWSAGHAGGRRRPDATF